jgi:phosphoribosylformylglycinamidine synthase
MWQFSQVIDGMTLACEELEAPITGGNVSFYNETLSEGIYPTPVIGVVGILEEVDKAVGYPFRAAEREVLVLRGSEAGDEVDAQSEFGSSEYAKEVLGRMWGYPPSLDLEKEAALQKCLVELVGAGLVESAHDVSDGGVAVALAEACFDRNLGLTADFAAAGLAPELVLFGEDASRVVISCDPQNTSRIKEVAVRYGVAADAVGRTNSSGQFRLSVDGRTAVSAEVSELKDAWGKALERALHPATPERLVVDTLQKS